MSRSTRALGAFGEAAAADFLKRKGFRILARNWRCARGEVDLVARHRRTLVFVEVKTRQTSSPHSPESAVDRPKQIRLRRAGADYLQHHTFKHWDGIRFDVVAVRVNPRDEVVAVRHFEDAF